MITCALINRSTAEFFGLTVPELKSARRTREVVAARHAACWLARTMTQRSLPEIGRHIGGFDHTSVLHACRRIDAARSGNVKVAAELAQLELIIRTAAGVLEEIHVEPEQDIDARAVARRMLEQPLSQFTVSIEEMRAMAAYIIAASEDPEPPRSPEPEIIRQIVTVTRETDPGLCVAAKAVCKAYGTLEQDRFTSGERTAQARLETALKALRSHFDMKSKQERGR